VLVQQDNQAIQLWGNYMEEQKLEYLNQNPVVFGFVSCAEGYIYISAKDYCGETVSWKLK